MCGKAMDKSIENSEHQKHVSGARRTSRRIVIVIALVLVLAAAGLAYYFMNRDDSSKDETPTEQAIEQSTQAFDKGDFQQARTELEGALTDTNDPQEQVQIYTNLSATAASDGDVKGALEYLAKKHEIAPDTAKEDAYIMAQYYERLSKPQQALAQYKAALNYFESVADAGDEQIGLDSRINNAKARIAELEDQ